MLLAISILLGIDFIVNIGNDELQVLPTAALIVLLWTLCFPLAIVLLIVTFLYIVIKLINN